MHQKNVWNASINVWKYVTSNNARVRGQRYTKDSVFWLAQMVCVMMLRFSPCFVGSNVISYYPTNWLTIHQLYTIISDTFPAPLSPLMMHDWFMFSLGPLLLLSLRRWNAASAIAKMWGSTALIFLLLKFSTWSYNHTDIDYNASLGS